MVAKRRSEYASQSSAVVEITGRPGMARLFLPSRVRQHECDTGERVGRANGVARRIQQLKREPRELRQAHETAKPSVASVVRTKLDRPPRWQVGGG